jgi:hypothetical protein
VDTPIIPVAILNATAAFERTTLNQPELLCTAPIHVDETTEAVEVEVLAAAPVNIATGTKSSKAIKTETTKGVKNDDRKEKKPATVHTLFNTWKSTVTKPESSPFWGTTSRTGDARPHADQPATRSSDAGVNPPLWEDHSFCFKRGSRHVKYFGPFESGGAHGRPDLDQEDLLVIKLMDMGKKSSKDMTPRRNPIFFAFEHGKPQEWNSMQATKTLNDRRGQAIDRITVDAPWSKTEREYLAALLAETPDASIWGLAECLNEHFMGEDHTAGTAFSCAGMSTGRTVESVRHEYRTYKPVYDNGEAPQSVRWRVDKSIAGSR